MGKKGIGSYVEDYLAFLSVEKGLAQRTINGYRVSLGGFFCSRGVNASEEVEEGTIRQYLAKERERGLSGASTGRKMSPIRGYFAFLVREGFIDRDPAKAIESPKREQKLPKYLSEKQMEDLFSVIEDPRDKAIVEILYASGIRGGELLNLCNGDIDLENKTLRIRMAKNGQERVAFINNSSVKAIRQYKKLEPWDEPFLDFNTMQNLHRILGEYGEMIGVELSPHMLRHTCATHLLNGGMNVLEVKEILGHESINSTQIYTHMEIEKLREDHNKLEEIRPKNIPVPTYDPKKHTRRELLLRFETLAREKEDGKGLETLSMKKTEWLMGVSRVIVKKAIEKGDIIAHVMGSKDGTPYQIKAESVGKMLNNPPAWIVQTWGRVKQHYNTQNLSSEEWAKKAYRILKENGKLPYPNANLTAKDREKYFSYDDMAEKLGISYSKYREIKPLVDILFETEKNIKNELVIQAVQAQFDKKIAQKGNKRLTDPQGEVLDAEYQVSEV